MSLLALQATADHGARSLAPRWQPVSPSRSADLCIPRQQRGGCPAAAHPELGKSLEADLIAMTSSRKLLAAGAMTLAMILTRPAYYWVTLWAIGIPLTLPAVIIGATFGEATYLLPIHGVAGLGTVEAGWTLGMRLIGMALAQAVASGLFVHVWSLALSTAVGCLSLPILWKPPVYSRQSDL